MFKLKSSQEKNTFSERKFLFNFSFTCQAEFCLDNEIKKDVLEIENMLG